MASGRQFQSAIVFGKNENLKTSSFNNNNGIYIALIHRCSKRCICIWHAKFKLIASPRATLGVMN